MQKLIGLLFLIPFLTYSQELKKIAVLPDVLRETSGLAIINDTLVATHNDGGGKAIVYYVDHKGKIQHKLSLTDVKNKDWEDLAMNNKGDLFVGDIGDNQNKRKHCSIYKIDHSKLFNKSVKPKRIKFTYPEKHKNLPEDSLYFDAEAMFCVEDSIYIFTKNRTVPHDGKVLVYVLPQKPGTYKARLKTSFILCTGGWQTCSITGADYNSIKDEVLFLTYRSMFSIQKFSSTKNIVPKETRLSMLKQREGIAIEKGGKSVLISDEKHSILGGGKLYRYKF